MELYPWFVFAHLSGLVLFAISHGASAFMAFRLRAARDAETAVALLDLGRLSLGPMYVGLLLLIVGGLGAAWVANLWGQTWLQVSIAVFVIILITMWSVASPYYMGLRKTLTEIPTGAVPPSMESIAPQLATRRPEVLTLVGLGGLLVLVWLMVLKPGF